MYHIFCIYSSVEGHLGSFQLLAIINKAAINIVKHVSLLHVGASSGYMHRRRTAGSSSTNMTNFLRNHQTDFQSGCTSLDHLETDISRDPSHNQPPNTDTIAYTSKVFLKGP